MLPIEIEWHVIIVLLALSLISSCNLYFSRRELMRFTHATVRVAEVCAVVATDRRSMMLGGGFRRLIWRRREDRGSEEVIWCWRVLWRGGGRCSADLRRRRGWSLWGDGRRRWTTVVRGWGGSLHRGGWRRTAVVRDVEEEGLWSVNSETTWRCLGKKKCARWMLCVDFRWRRTMQVEIGFFAKKKRFFFAFSSFSWMTGWKRREDVSPPFQPSDHLFFCSFF